MIGTIAEQGRDMTDIIDDLLVAARGDLADLEVGARVIDLADVARVVVDALAAERPVRITGGSLPAVADSYRVRQVVRNLVTNAPGSVDATSRFGRLQMRVPRCSA